jgi:gas vesicle protein
MASDNRGPGFSTGLILGALIGALAGLLLAPRPGEETRAQVKERTAGLRGTAEVLANEARERLREVVEEGRVVASRIMTGHEETAPEESSSDNRDERAS